MIKDKDTMGTTPRLLILIHSLRGGGAGRVCTFLANGLARRGWTVQVAVNLPGNQRWLAEFNTQVSVSQLGRSHARRALPALIKQVRDFRPTVVVAFNYQLAVLLPIVRRLSGVSFKAVGRTVVALSEAAKYRSFWQREIVMPFVRRRYRHLDMVIAQAEAMRRDLIQHFGLKEGQIAVINNPAEISKEQKEVEAKVSHSGEGPTLLYLGRFKPQKQPFLLLDMLEGLRRTEVGSHARLIAAGEGPLLNEFLSAAQERGLADAVEYRGYTDDIDSLFHEADVTVLVSRYEGFPNVLVESIARGVPFVSFDCPSGPSDIIEEGKNGHIVPLNDLSAFVKALEDVLKQPPAGGIVRSTAAKFHPETILDMYEQVLKQ